MQCEKWQAFSRTVNGVAPMGTLKGVMSCWQLVESAVKGATCCQALPPVRLPSARPTLLPLGSAAGLKTAAPTDSFGAAAAAAPPTLPPGVQLVGRAASAPHRGTWPYTAPNPSSKGFLQVPNWGLAHHGSAVMNRRIGQCHKPRQAGWLHLMVNIFSLFFFFLPVGTAGQALEAPAQHSRHRRLWIFGMDSLPEQNKHVVLDASSRTSCAGGARGSTCICGRPTEDKSFVA